MDDQKAWFTAAAGRRVTVTEIGDILGVSRKTAGDRVRDGLTADDIITVSRALHIDVVLALVELGAITNDEAHDFLESAGKLIGTATEGELAIELAQRLNTVRELRDALGPKPRHLTSLDPAEHLDAAAKPGEVVRGDPDDFEA